jgi:hypothetical protein
MDRFDWNDHKWKEAFMTAIDDLTTAVTALTAAIAANPPGGLSAADSTAIETNVTAINAATATLTGPATPPAAAAAGLSQLLKPPA